MPTQQTALDYHLRHTNRLSNEELIRELTDHYLIALAERMAQGIPFDTALVDVQQSFGGQRGLQKMEKEYNRVTFRTYNGLWMQAVREQIGWPRCLLLLCLTGLYWAMSTINQPPSSPTDTTDIFFTGPWSGFGISAIIVVTFTIGQLIIRNGIRYKGFSYRAIYLATRVLPTAILLYGVCALLTYISSYFSPFIYKVITTFCLAITWTYLISYSRFYKGLLKDAPTAN